MGERRGDDGDDLHRLVGQLSAGDPQGRQPGGPQHLIPAAVAIDGPAGGVKAKAVELDDELLLGQKKSTTKPCMGTLASGAGSPASRSRVSSRRSPSERVRAGLASRLSTARRAAVPRRPDAQSAAAVSWLSAIAWGRARSAAASRDQRIAPGRPST